MISVILYGRNDSHGYNLHKRAAISLNCIAEVLTGREDEIIFVDYNSPDQIPTFPEAIADTLTDKAAKLLRIIRVREAYHRQFASQTHLVALESQSRNIAVRRAHASNRWILSTNTDMIFVPRITSRSLTDSILELEHGFYHLPRFEVPEALWETLDRKSPDETIRRVARWGTRLHLNEIVYGGFDNVYEASGDFQLFLREDLIQIGGFDESMTRGWHVDSNIARRMKLLRGQVRTAADHVFGYHCGHTRQPTALHKSGFIANSIDTYVRNVEDPVVHEQLHNWGAPEWEFEERRISRNSIMPIERALAAAIASEGPEISEVTLNDDSFDRTQYEPSHVLPHLINLVGEAPAGRVVLLVGTDSQLFQQLTTTLAELDLKPTFLWVDAIPECSFAENVGLKEGLSRADIIILQFPSYDPQESDEWATSRWWVQRAFETIVAAERERPLEERRLVILVNAAHSKLQDSFLPAMTFTAIPYTARLRHGFVTLLPFQENSGAEMFNNRARPFSEDELAMTRHLVEFDDSSQGWERLALELPALVKQAELNPLDPPVATLLAKAQSHIGATADRCFVTPVSVVARDVTASRLCAAVDWEDRQWLDLAERCFGSQVYAQGSRSRWIWERVSLLHSLRANVDEHDRPWVLVVSNGPDPLPTMTAYFGYRVAFASFDAFMKGTEEDPDTWQQSLRIWNMISHVDLLPLHSAVDRGVGSFNAIILAGADISAEGTERFAMVGKRISELCAPDAYVSAATLVHLNGGAGGALSYREWASLFEDDGIASQIGLFPAGQFDPRIPLDTAVRFAAEDRTEYVPGLSFGWGDSIVTIGVLNGWLGSPASARQMDVFEIPTVDSFPPDAAENESPVPEEVLMVAADTLSRTFACRVIPGLARELAVFARLVANDGQRSWWVLPLEIAKPGPLLISTGSEVDTIAMVGGNGSLTLASQESEEKWSLAGHFGKASLLVRLTGTKMPDVRIS